MGSAHGEKTVFFRGLSALVGSGCHLLNAVELMGSPQQAPSLHPALERLAVSLSQGQRLSESMRRQGGVFSGLEVALVRVGEETGSLHSVLVRLADLAEKNQALRQRLIASLTYPTFVIVLCGALLLFAPAYVFSDLLEMFRRGGQDLPLATRLYLVANDLLTSPAALLVIAGLLAGVATGLRRALQNEELRLKLERALLELPGLGAVLKASLAAEFFRALAVCSQAGLPILSALDLSGRTAWSRLLGLQARECAVSLRNGASVSESLAGLSLVPKLQLALVASGEEAGRLAEAFERVADHSQEHLAYSLEQAQKLLEPAILLAIGAVVAFLAVALLSPMFHLLEAL